MLVHRRSARMAARRLAHDQSGIAASSGEPSTARKSKRACCSLSLSPPRCRTKNGKIVRETSPDPYLLRIDVPDDVRIRIHTMQVSSKPKIAGSASESIVMRTEQSSKRFQRVGNAGRSSRKSQRRHDRCVRFNAGGAAQKAVQAT